MHWALPAKEPVPLATEAFAAGAPKMSRMDTNRENLLILVVILALVLYRSARPQRTSVTRMWIYAGILIAVAALSLYTSMMLFHPPLWEMAVAIVLGFVAGIPVGLLRGHHTQVSTTDRHGVMQLGPSWQTAAIYIGALAGRFLIRMFLPPGSIGNVVSDGLLFFAIGIVGATYFAIYQKYEALDHAPAQT
jgi:Protein of unknown function (DUF1453)